MSLIVRKRLDENKNISDPVEARRLLLDFEKRAIMTKSVEAFYCKFNFSKFRELFRDNSIATTKRSCFLYHLTFKCPEFSIVLLQTQMRLVAPLLCSTLQYLTV